MQRLTISVLTLFYIVLGSSLDRLAPCVIVIAIVIVVGEHVYLQQTLFVKVFWMRRHQSFQRAPPRSHLPCTTTGLSCTVR
jgi:hypothetical protein